MLFFLFFLLVSWDRASCIPGWPPTHYVAEDYLELWIFLPQLPKCWEFTGIHHHTQQDSISKNYKKGTNFKKKTQKTQKTNKPTILQRMVTPTFPRQLLEVEFHFTENFIFQNKAKGEANILLVNLHGPHWAISSHEKDWTQHPSQMWNWSKPKAQYTPNCWQDSAISTHAANRKGNGYSVNIPKQSA